MLLLDEPTNHLDLDAVEALIHAILNFDGGVLVISHDEHLVSSICGELWVAEPGRVTKFKSKGTESEFAEYRRQQLKLTKQGMQPPRMPAAAPVDVADEDTATDAKPAAVTKSKTKIEFVRNSGKA